MSVTATSKSTYAWLQKCGLGGACRRRVFSAAISLQRCTRRQLEDATQLRPNQIAGRVSELIECGALRKDGYTNCPISGRFVEVIAPVPAVANRYLAVTEESAA